VFLFLIDGSGAASVVQDPVSTSATVTPCPVANAADSLCIAATLKVVCGTANFVPGTDALNKANVTFTFSDGYDGSLAGPSQIAPL
jgi:peptidoglycan/xylan/chitin deacetylase (PgdA/CDA1 family)